MLARAAARQREIAHAATRMGELRGPVRHKGMLTRGRGGFSATIAGTLGCFLRSQFERAQAGFAA